MISSTFTSSAPVTRRAARVNPLGGLPALRLVGEHAPDHPAVAPPRTVEVPRVVLLAGVPLPDRLSPRRLPSSRRAHLFVRSLLDQVLHPETAPVPRDSVVVGMCLAAVLVLAYTVFLVVTGGAR